MATITKEMYDALKKPLPKEAIKPHPTKSFLSTIKAIYVTERLNDVFGTGKWKVKTDFERIEGKMVVCKTILEIPEYDVYYECFGGNDNADLGDAFKGATTDAITKIGSYLGIGIDVFKGLKDTPAPTSTTAPVKPTTTTSPKNQPSEEDIACLVLECQTVNEAKEYLKANKIDIKKYPGIQSELNKKFNLK